MKRRITTTFDEELRARQNSFFVTLTPAEASEFNHLMQDYDFDTAKEIIEKRRIYSNQSKEKKNMIIVGIDPGPEKQAFVYWDSEKGILAAKEGIIHKMYFQVPIDFEVVKKKPISKIDHIAIEMVQCFGMPIGEEVIQTILNIGRMTVIFPNAKLIRRSEIKLNLCGSQRATDANIRQALMDRFGKPGTKKEPGYTYLLKGHLWQAFAVAVTYFDQMKEEKK